MAVRSKDALLKDARSRLEKAGMGQSELEERLIWMEIAIDIRDTLVVIEDDLP